MMSKEQMMAAVKQGMPDKRWVHTQGVMQSAVELANLYQADIEKAELAAMLHDVAKYWPIDQQVQAAAQYDLPKDLLEYDRQLLHAPIGAEVAHREFGVTDELVLDAIRYHTSGRVGMTTMDKIVCLADYIEPGRNFPGVDHIRALARESLEQALIAGFDSTISHLIAQGKRIYPLTVLSRNALILELQSL